MTQESLCGKVLSYLYGLQKFGVKLGLENIRAILGTLGDPHLRYPTIHVAGTNGKGSVCAIIASILQEAGFNVGMYTSPHLVNFNERIKVNGMEIPMEQVERLVHELKPEIDRRNATFFEAATAMAFQFFMEEEVDIAVIETGLGGRLDASNVILPIVSVITSISLEHTEYLGGTIRQIAREKAGIIKPGIPVVCGALPSEALSEILTVAVEMESTVLRVDQSVKDITIHDVDHMTITMTFDGEPLELHSPVVGEHQVDNILVALKASAIALTALGREPERSFFLQGVSNVRRNTGIHGRLARIGINPEIVVDVAHNPDGVRRLLQTWTRSRAPENTHLVFGLLVSKDFQAIAAEIVRHSWASISIVESKASDSRAADEIISAIGEKHCRGFPSVMDGFRNVSKLATADQSVLVFGSHHVVGEILSEWHSQEKHIDNSIN